MYYVLCGNGLGHGPPLSIYLCSFFLFFCLFFFFNIFKAMFSNHQYSGTLVTTTDATATTIRTLYPYYY